MSFLDSLETVMHLSILLMSCCWDLDSPILRSGRLLGLQSLFHSPNEEVNFPENIFQETHQTKFNYEMQSTAAKFR